MNQNFQRSLIANFLILLFLSASASAAEIKTPSDLSNCIHQHIQMFLTAAPEYQESPKVVAPAGDYAFASWIDPLLPAEYSFVFMSVSPSDPIFCSYPEKADGTPDFTKSGSCEATLQNGDVSMTYIHSSPNEAKGQEKIAAIVNSKIYCQ